MVKMKTIGLIGGMSSKSSEKYYSIINQTINKILGGHHGAKLVMVSLNSHDVMTAMHENRWEDLTTILVDAANQLISAKVDFIGICCNSAHKIVSVIEDFINVPLIHILSPVVSEIKKRNIQTVGILGTKFIIQDGFYQKYFLQFGINSVIPTEREREIVHSIIFDELCHGYIRACSKEKLLLIINRLNKLETKGIILGCTELSLIINEQNVQMPIFDSTVLHAEALAHYALD